MEVAGVAGEEVASRRRSRAATRTTAAVGALLDAPRPVLRRQAGDPPAAVLRRLPPVELDDAAGGRARGTRPARPIGTNHATRRRAGARRSRRRGGRSGCARSPRTRRAGTASSGMPGCTRRAGISARGPKCGSVSTTSSPSWIAKVACPTQVSDAECSTPASARAVVRDARDLRRERTCRRGCARTPTSAARPTALFGSASQGFSKPCSSGCRAARRAIRASGASPRAAGELRRAAAQQPSSSAAASRRTRSRTAGAASVSHALRVATRPARRPARRTRPRGSGRAAATDRLPKPICSSRIETSCG